MCVSLPPKNKIACYKRFRNLKLRIMKDFFFNTIQEFNDYIGVKTLHPLVSIARVENISPIQEAVHHYGLYALFLKETRDVNCHTAEQNMTLMK